MKIRPTKTQVIKLITEKAPEYLDFFREFQAHDNGWLVWPEELKKAKQNLKLDNYVNLYEDQKRIEVCLFLYMMGVEGFKKWKDDLTLLSPEDQQKQAEAITQDILEGDFSMLEEALSCWPSELDFVDEIETKEQFDALDEDIKNLLIQRWQYLFLHLLSAIHNYFAIMVCGESMTSLVPKAMAGDEDAFCMAVKIDRNLLMSHPYFVERYQRAQSNGERDFLKRLAPYQVTPQLIGRIRYPGLYIIFSMLDSLKWLDDFTHNEILDICDAAGLDRWQNRIEDVNAVTKQLARYRRYQKTGGLSMH